MASEEAKAMLDALMGADRNAPLPRGAAIPTKSKNNNKRDRNGGGGGGLVLPGKRHKSCYDKDIDPLYTAWGIDVYELFVNTKSDLGTNPYLVDKGAREEFQQLPGNEQTRLGFHYFLFQKLSELVRQCDRTVNRNKEKLKQELNRKLSQRGGQDFVEDVDDNAVEILAQDMIQLDDMITDLNRKLHDLNDLVKQEESGKEKLEPILESVRKANQLKPTNPVVVPDSNMSEADGKSADNTTTNDPVKQEQSEEEVVVKEEMDTVDIPVKKEETEDENMTEMTPSGGDVLGEVEVDNSVDLEQIQAELGRITLTKQRILFDIGRHLILIGPLQTSVETQRRQLNYVRSDISTDKTVCDISGNFMSARDADERIAAHYAGKQYVGWKLVRDKLALMIKQYGPYGPPPPGSRMGPGGPPNADNMSNMNSSQGRPPPSNSSGGGRRGDSGGNRFDRGGGGGGGGSGGGGGYRGGPPDRGGGGRSSGPPPPYRGGGGGGPPPPQQQQQDRRGGPPPDRMGPPDHGRWERGAPSGYYDRGPPRGGGGGGGGGDRRR